jgi:hypothetical protein
MKSATNKSQQQQNNNNVIIMSGKCKTTNSTAGDSTDRSSQHTIISSYGTSNISNIDQQKIREYQQSLLQRDPNQQQPQIPELDLNLNIELRKKEILQRFGLTDMTNFNKFNNEKQIAPSIAQLSEDKYTISTDSGFASWRPNIQQQHHSNNQRMTTTIIRSDRQQQQQTNNNQDTSFESTVDQLEHDNTPIVSQQKASKLFGLEYFDSQNSEVRDLSIEHLVGWMESHHNSSSKLTTINNKSNSSLVSITDLKQIPIESSHTRNDTLYESTLSTSTCDEGVLPQSFNNTDDGIEETTSATSDDCDDSSNIIMSLLNSRKMYNEDYNYEVNNNDDDDEEALEMRRRLIEQQLELVRAQKEQLIRSQNMLTTNNENDNNIVYSNNLPMKFVVSQKVFIFFRNGPL